MSKTEHKPVTGPDGDNPITNKQIEKVRERCSEHGEGLDTGHEYYETAVALNICDEALGDFEYGNLPQSVVEERHAWSRARCADAYNARFVRNLEGDVAVSVKQRSAGMCACGADDGMRSMKWRAIHRIVCSYPGNKP